LPAKIGALPHIGRDLVKIHCADGHENFVVRGQSALAQCENSLHAKQFTRTKEELMSAIRSEQTEPKDDDSNLAAVSEVEAGIRDFVRNDIAYLRRAVPGMVNSSSETGSSSADAPLEATAEATVNSVNSLIQRVAGTSLSEIEKLVSELESLRDLLHAEGQRVQREISGYAQLSQAAMKSTRLIADNVAQWKRTADGLRHD
jgi:hypothetical protein